MRAQITLADRVPGLFNVVLADGREFRDLTIGQLGAIQRKYGLELQWPEAEESETP